MNYNAKLTPREKEILIYVVNGLYNKEIAAKIFRSPKTVEKHRNSIFRKLETDTITFLVKYAIKNRLISI